MADREPLVLEHLREEYRLAEFNERTCDSDPIRQFKTWFADAKAANLKEPNAMALATAAPDGKPSNRIVLLKEVEGQGFIFYTSYTSRKGREFDINSSCALVFFWAELERQVRIEGHVQKVSREKSDRYFRGRPKGSRLGALVSNQSEILPGREPLNEKLACLEAQYALTDDVPTPDYWGGYCVTPDSLEFWQGRANRLHDRILYSRRGSDWQIERLSP